MNVARTTYRAALVAAAISCLGYASLASADGGDWRGGGHGRWSEQRGPARDYRDDRRYGDHGGRYDRHWGDRGGYRGWAPPPPRYWRPPTYYYAPPPRYYRPYPRAYGGWRGAGYGYRSGDWCDDGSVSLTVRIPF